jgi:hypothetical protein
MMLIIARPVPIVFLLLYIIIEVCLHQSALALFFGHSIALSPYASSSFSPQIAVSGSNVYVVWSSTNITSPSSSSSSSSSSSASRDRADIYFKKSTDYGNTFDNIVSLSSGNIGVSGSPQIAVSGSNVYVVWIGIGSSGGGGVGGGTNSNNTKNNASAGNDTTNENDCCGSGMYFRRSTDNGTTFANGINLDKNGRSNSPQIAVSGSNVYLMWVNNDSYTEPQISFRYSTDYGSIFSGIVVDLSHTTSNAKNPHSPQIAVSGSNVYVVWTSSSSTTSNSNHAKNNSIFAGSEDGSVIYFKRISELFFVRNT